MGWPRCALSREFCAPSSPRNSHHHDEEGARNHHVEVNETPRLGEGMHILVTGCKWTGILRDLDNHLQNECIMRKIACKYQEFGCNILVNKIAQGIHEKQDVYMHLGCFVDDLQKVSLRILCVFC